MPSNILTADTSFPQLNDRQSSDEKFTLILNYLYMLLEQLRYSMANLGKENFNQAEFDSIANIITQPVYIQLKNAQGDISSLQVTAAGLTSRIQDAEGNVSTLQQTAKSLTSRISNAEGNVSTLQQTAASLTSRIQSAEGNISTLQQTVSGITLSVSNLQAGMGQTLRVAADGITITNAAGSRLTIDGGQLRANSVRASTLEGGAVALLTNQNAQGGVLTITGASSADFAVDLTSYGSLRLTASTGAVFVHSAQGGAYLGLDNTVVLGAGNVRSNVNGIFSCGMSNYAWSDVYASNAVIQTSDLTKKHDIVYGLEGFDGFFDDLKPFSFRFSGEYGTSGRKHHGLGAQEVEQALLDHGFTGMDFAGLVKSSKRDEEGAAIEGEYDYFLRYGEFIPMCIEQIQKLKRRVAELETRLYQ